VGKNKLARFQELAMMERVFQPAFEEVFQKDYYLKGKWAKEVFRNDHPLVLELGCGKGEYTVGMATRFLDKNFLGVDIKGARIWRGASTANEENIKNAGFLRTRIEFIPSFFSKDEVSEIWLTFPDPQEKKRRRKKRLTGSRFLNLYRSFLVDNGIIHLKTDNKILFEYTAELARYNNLDILYETSDLYHSDYDNDILDIKTFYEKQFLEQAISIKYIQFRLPSSKTIIELPDED
jgi:tRNA (guanine-N7-)-methyltransferase